MVINCLLNSAIKNEGIVEDVKLDFWVLVIRWGVPVIFIIGLIILLFLAKKFFAKYKVDKFDGKKITKERATMMRIIYSVIRFIIVLIIVLTILRACGVNISGAVAGLGIVGAIGALAVQDLLKDLIMGANIVSEKYFSIGDVVEFEGKVGIVQHLSMRCTKIKLVDGSVLSVGNHYIEQIVLISDENRIDVPLPYELKSDEAEAVMKKIVEAVKKVPKVSNAKYGYIAEFAPSSVNHTLLFYCNPRTRHIIRKQVNSVIFKELENAGISIPYSQIVVHSGDDRK